MISRLRRALWFAGILKGCPECRSDLMVHGLYPHERFTCETCGFGKGAIAREVQRR